MAAATMLVVALPGLMALVRVLGHRGLSRLQGALPAASIQLATGLVIGVLGWLCARGTDGLDPWVSLVISGALVAVLFLVTLPMRPEWKVMRSRGLLPARVRSSTEASPEVPL